MNTAQMKQVFPDLKAKEGAEAADVSGVKRILGQSVVPDPRREWDASRYVIVSVLPVAPPVSD
ncbi:MAG: hypothetical protein K6T30_01130 [Alicyclobacillus sp.]|nr:hypothetical protein [Alicyclobacillus sp.]